MLGARKNWLLARWRDMMLRLHASDWSLHYVWRCTVAQLQPRGVFDKCHSDDAALSLDVQFASLNAFAYLQ